MGYTHYYCVKGWHTAEWQVAWLQLIEEVPLILEAADTLISGPCDNDEYIVPPIVNVDEGICFNGVANDSHETFCLSQEFQDGFVKTLMKPYDTAVACILLRAYLLAPNNFQLHSDGTWNEIYWKKVRRLYQDLWPGEPIWSPLHEDSSDAESKYDKTSEEFHSKAQNIDEAPLVRGIPDVPAEIDEISERLRLDPTSSSQLELVNSTVLEVDFSHIRQWLSLCEEDISHSECKTSLIQWQNLPGVRFKVIDVHQRCIVNAPDGCSFVGLSYVWGGVDQPKLTAKTAPLLMRKGGLEAIWAQIPMTIRDAITVCERLGERYLWIDVFCIIQDSVRDMKLQILRMRQIYATAKCTIVAVSADTAEIGLLGNTSVKGYHPCDSVDCLNRLVDSSPWSHRAWCYQEKVLSHRVILFTSIGIYMQCQNGTYHVKGTLLKMSKEGRCLTRFNDVGGMLSVPPGEELEAYVSAVEHYSQRKLTIQEDKLNAFQGIIKIFGGILDGNSNSFCYGLPVSAFDQTFCWSTHHHNPQLRNRDFPSWSWLGWNDAVSFDRKMIQRARTSQILYRPNPYIYYDDDTNSYKVQNPAAVSLDGDDKFGFPSSVISSFYNIPKRTLFASAAHLRIAPDSVESGDSSGLYAVFPTACSKSPPQTPSWVKSVEEYNLSEHENHVACEAKTPLGYIWLNREWRVKQPNQYIMGFIALAGEKDVNREGQSTITMLMCLMGIEENCYQWKMERVQVMQCEIEEERWLKTGAEVVHIDLT